MSDFTYTHTNDGLFILVLPNNRSAEIVWAEIAAATDGTGKVLAGQFQQLRRALKSSGYTCRKGKKTCAVDIDAILKDLSI
jgi:hypothetical protein